MLFTNLFLDRLASDISKAKVDGMRIRMLVLPQSTEEDICKLFIGKEWPKEVFDIRPNHGKIHLYLYNVQVMFTKKPCRFYYLLSPLKEKNNEPEQSNANEAPGSIPA